MKPGHTYQVPGFPELMKCKSVNKCRAAVHPVSQPSKVYSISPEAEVREVKRA